MVETSELSDVNQHTENTPFTMVFADSIPVRALFYRLCHLVESFFVMGQGLFVSGSSIRS